MSDRGPAAAGGDADASLSPATSPGCEVLSQRWSTGVVAMLCTDPERSVFRVLVERFHPDTRAWTQLACLPLDQLGHVVDAMSALQAAVPAIAETLHADQDGADD